MERSSPFRVRSHTKTLLSHSSTYTAFLVFFLFLPGPFSLLEKPKGVFVDGERERALEISSPLGTLLLLLSIVWYRPNTKSRQRDTSKDSFFSPSHVTATLRGSRCHSSDDLFRGENGRWASLFFLSFPAVSPASAGAQKKAGGLRWSGFSRTEKVWGKKKEENLKR